MRRADFYILLVALFLGLSGMVFGALSESDQFPTLEALLQERSQLELEYTDFFLKSISISYPDRLGGHKQEFQEDKIGIDYCRFRIVFDQVTAETWRVAVSAANITLSPLALRLDLDGNGVLETVGTGYIRVHARPLENRYGSVYLEDGAFDFPFELEVQFLALRDMTGGEPTIFSAESTGKFNLSDGSLASEEVVVMQGTRGPFQGVELILLKWPFDPPPPPDIVCECDAKTKRECKTKHASCKVDGILGDCRQCSYGCACTNPRNNNPMKYYCR